VRPPWVVGRGYVLEIPRAYRFQDEGALAKVSGRKHIRHSMKEITFDVDLCAETGGFVARWDDKPGSGGITTQGDSLADLHASVADAVNGYFEDAKPERVRLHFIHDPVVSLA
jgi:predicted RNase H-like HicB family nuclease